MLKAKPILFEDFEYYNTHHLILIEGTLMLVSFLELRQENIPEEKEVKKLKH